MRIVYQMQLSKTPYFTQVCLDPEYYHRWALRLLKNGWLDDTVFLGNPLYPYFLAVIYRIFGTSFTVVRCIQHCMGLLTCFFVYRIGMRWFSRFVGVAACTVLLLYPVVVFYEGSLVIATLSLFLHTAGIWITAERKSRKPVWLWLLVGIVFGLAYAARGSLIITAIPLWLLVWSKDGAFRQRLGYAAIYGVGAALILFPFALHNFHVGGKWVLTTSHWGEAFYVGNNPNANGGNTQPEFVRPSPFTEHEDFRLEAERRTGRKMNLEMSSRYWFHRACIFIRSYPGKFIRLLILKTFYFFHSYERPDNINIYFLRTYQRILPFPFISYGMFMPFAVVGMILCMLRKRRVSMLLALAYILYGASIILFFVTSRYRVPSVFLSAVFAGYAFFYLIFLIVKKKNKAVLIMCGILLLAGIPLNVFGPKKWNSVIECNRLGTLYTQAKQAEQAYRWYMRAYKINPKDPLTLYNLGIVTRELQRHHESVEWFKKALINNRFPEKARYELAATYFQLNAVESAIEQLKFILSENASEERALNLLAICYASQNNYEQARNLWEKIIVLNPDYIDAPYNLGIYWLNQGKKQVARDYFFSVSRLNPDYKNLHNLLKESQ
ncbi:tetratricopeptide repeat protein [bacterium]|nr:tetratricopeptide repeat protein [bacterium]MCP5462642.1 tetratricopeptide repeat protein [bacterium]